MSYGVKDFTLDILAGGSYTFPSTLYIRKM